MFVRFGVGWSFGKGAAGASIYTETFYRFERVFGIIRPRVRLGPLTVPKFGCFMYMKDPATYRPY